MFSKTVAAFLLLVAVGCGASSPVKPDGAEPFLGMWLNEAPGGNFLNDIPEIRENTRVQITRQINGIVVHMWGACTPECDWGTVRAPSSSVDDEVLELTWNQGFVVRTQKLTITQNGRLRVESVSDYTDDRPDRTSVEFFVK